VQIENIQNEIMKLHKELALSDGLVKTAAIRTQRRHLKAKINVLTGRHLRLQSKLSK
jgi:hypothetical protein